MAWYNKLFNANTVGAAASGFLQGYSQSLQNRWAAEDREAASKRSAERAALINAPASKESIFALQEQGLNDLASVRQEQYTQQQLEEENRLTSEINNLLAEYENLKATRASERDIEAVSSLGTRARKLLGDVKSSQSDTAKNRAKELEDIATKSDELFRATHLTNASREDLQSMYDRALQTNNYDIANRALEALRENGSITEKAYTIGLSNNKRNTIRADIKSFLDAGDYEEARKLATENSAYLDPYTFDLINSVEQDSLQDTSVKAISGIIAAGDPRKFNLADQMISTLDEKQQELYRSMLDRQSQDKVAEVADDMSFAITSQAYNIVKNRPTEYTRLLSALNSSGLSLADARDMATGEGGEGGAGDRAGQVKGRLWHLIMDDEGLKEEYQKAISEARMMVRDNPRYQGVIFRNETLPLFNSEDPAENAASYAIRHMDPQGELDRLVSIGAISLPEKRQAEILIGNVTQGDPKLQVQITTLQNSDEQNFLSELKDAFANDVDNRATIYATALRNALKGEQAGLFSKGFVTEVDNALKVISLDEEMSAEEKAAQAALINQPLKPFETYSDPNMMTQTGITASQPSNGYRIDPNRVNSLRQSLFGADQHGIPEGVFNNNTGIPNGVFDRNGRGIPEGTFKGPQRNRENLRRALNLDQRNKALSSNARRR